MEKFSRCQTVVLEQRLTRQGFSSAQEFLTRRWHRTFLIRALTAITIALMEAPLRGTRMPLSTTRGDLAMISHRLASTHRSRSWAQLALPPPSTIIPNTSTNKPRIDRALSKVRSSRLFNTTIRKSSQVHISQMWTRTRVLRRSANRHSLRWRSR